MNLVPQTLNEVIKHLSPRSPEEIQAALNKEFDTAKLWEMERLLRTGYKISKKQNKQLLTRIRKIRIPMKQSVSNIPDGAGLRVNFQFNVANITVDYYSLCKNDNEEGDKIVRAFKTNQGKNIIGMHVNFALMQFGYRVNYKNHFGKDQERYVDHYPPTKYYRYKKESRPEPLRVKTVKLTFDIEKYRDVKINQENLNTIISLQE